MVWCTLRHMKVALFSQVTLSLSKIIIPCDHFDP